MDSPKKYILTFLYRIFLKLFNKEKQLKKIYSSDTLNILLIEFGTIQKSLLTTPLIKVLHNKINCSITLLVKNHNNSAYSNNPFINNTIIHGNETFSILTTISVLQKKKFDVVIDLHEYLNKEASLILGLLRSESKIGFVKEDVSLLTHKLFLQDPNRVHIVDRVLSLSDAFEIYYSKANLNIIFKTSDYAKKIIEGYKIKNDLSHKITVLVNTSAIHGIGFWGIDNYKKLVKYIENYNVNIIISASIEDIEIAESLSNNKHLIFYDTELDIFAELINNVDFIFSPNSYTIQLAAAYKTPIFCLFVQHKTAEMINVPYNSDFDFALTEKQYLADISYGKVLNSFIPYFEYIYERYSKQ